MVPPFGPNEIGPSEIGPSEIGPGEIVRRSVEMVAAQRGERRARIESFSDLRVMNDARVSLFWGFAHRMGSILVKPYCS